MTQETSPPSLDPPNSSLEHQTVSDASGPTGGLTSKTVGGKDAENTGVDAPLNCPYCGGSASLFASSDHSTAWEGGCSNEACEVQPSVWKASKAEAIAAWNRRAAPGGQTGSEIAQLCALKDREAVAVNLLQYGGLNKHHARRVADEIVAAHIAQGDGNADQA